jgi:CRP-like cAMP-binding protein
VNLRPLTTSDERALRGALAALGVRSEAGQRAGVDAFTSATVPRHTFLLQAGAPVEYAGLVLTGVLREYYVLEDGDERTRSFALPLEAFGSAADALSNRPSRVFCRAETAARVLLLPWDTLTALVASSTEWERLQNAVVRALYLKKAQREFELLGLDALGRYLSMRTQYPGLEDLVPQVLIASYLGITPVHLSRLRRKLRDQARAAARAR